MVLRVLGDSHSLWSFAAIAEAKIYWRGPITMHRAARDGISSLIPWWLRMRPDDHLILSFGDIDARMHIAKHAALNGRSVTEEADALCDRFELAIRSFRASSPAKLAICCLIPFPPVLPKHDEQRAIRNRMNERLSSMGMPFIDFRAAFDSGDGSIRTDMWDGNVHILPTIGAPVAGAVASALAIECTLIAPPTRLKLRSEPRSVREHVIRYVGSRISGIGHWNGIRI